MICLVVLWITMLLHCTAAKMQRTVIVMQAEAPQLKLYIRGGVDSNFFPEFLLESVIFWLCLNHKILFRQKNCKFQRNNQFNMF